MVFRYFTLLSCVIVFQAIDSVVLSYVNLRVKESAFFLKSNRLRLVQITRRWDSQRVCFLSYILRTNRNAYAWSWIHSHVCPRIVGLITARDRANAFMYIYVVMVSVWVYTIRFLHACYWMAKVNCVKLLRLYETRVAREQRCLLPSPPASINR